MSVVVVVAVYIIDVVVATVVVVAYVADVVVVAYNVAVAVVVLVAVVVVSDAVAVFIVVAVCGGAVCDTIIKCCFYRSWYCLFSVVLKVFFFFLVFSLVVAVAVVDVAFNEDAVFYKIWCGFAVEVDGNGIGLDIVVVVVVIASVIINILIVELAYDFDG